MWYRRGRGKAEGEGDAGNSFGIPAPLIQHPASLNPQPSTDSEYPTAFKINYRKCRELCALRACVGAGFAVRSLRRVAQYWVVLHAIYGHCPISVLLKNFQALHLTTAFGFFSFMECRICCATRSGEHFASWLICFTVASLRCS